MNRHLSVFAALAAALSGCATPLTLNTIPDMTDTQICVAFFSSRPTNVEKNMLENEFYRRHQHKDCRPLLAQREKETAASNKVIEAILLGAAVYGASRNAPLNYAGSGADWDGFFENGIYVWRCRNIANGQFIDQAYCMGLPQTDLRWPSKYTW